MTGHPGVVVTLDGEVHPPGTPLLFADDLAAVRGDGVFETLLVRDGKACLVEAHLGRLSHSSKLLDLPEPWLDSAFVGELDPDEVLLMPDGTIDAWSEDLLELVSLA